jgi:hypothetical protein
VLVISIPVFFGGVEMNPCTVCFCQAVAAIISCGVAPNRQKKEELPREICRSEESRCAHRLHGMTYPRVAEVLDVSQRAIAFGAPLLGCWAAGAGRIRKQERFGLDDRPHDAPPPHSLTL